MNKIYLVRSYNENCGELIVGHATTEEKANNMVEKLISVFEDSFEYEVIPAETDMLFVNDKEINF